MNDNPKLIKNGGEGTNVGRFIRGLKDVAPDILNIAGAVTGIDALKVLGDKIKGSNSISEQDKIIALEMLKLDIAEAEEVTKRWQADSLSDSWLSKNVRPMALIFLTVSMALYIIIDSSVAGFDVKEQWIELLSSLLLLIYAAYFGGRSLEKIQSIRKK
jgi:hypothetical protein